MVPWVGLQCVIVVFPDHTYLLFYVTSRLYYYVNVVLAENMNLQKMIHVYINKFEIAEKNPIIFCKN